MVCGTILAYICGVNCGVNMKSKILSIKFYFQSYVSEGKRQLCIRVSEGRDLRKYIPTSFKLNTALWDVKKQMVKASHPEADIINTGLLEYKRKIDVAQAKYQANVFNADKVYNFISGKADVKSLDNYVESHYKATYDETTYDNTKDRLKYFKKALNINKDLLFKDISVSLVKKYQRIQNKKIKAKEISSTTASAYVSAVMTICSEAYTEGDISEEITIPKKYRKFEKLHTGENYSNTSKELFEAIENCHTLQRFEAIGQWLLMFGMRGIYQADIPSINEGILMEHTDNGKMMPFKEVTENKYSNWAKASMWLDHRRRKKGDMPMFIKLNRPIMLLIEKLKYSYMYTHSNYKIGGKYIVSDVNERLSIVSYDVAKYPKKHHSLWRNRQKLLKKVNPELVRFKDARKTFFQLAEQLGDTLQAKQLCGQTVDSLASTFYSNYKNEGIVEKVDKLHMKVLQEFKFAEIIRKLFDKFTEIVKTGKDAPLWLLKESAVFKDVKGWKVLTGFSDKKPDYNYIDKKYHRFFDDNSLNEGYWADLNKEWQEKAHSKESQAFDMIMKKIALTDKKKHITDDKKETIDDNRTIEQAVERVLEKREKARQEENNVLDNQQKIEKLQLQLEANKEKEDYLKCAELQKEIKELEAV